MLLNNSSESNTSQRQSVQNILEKYENSKDKIEYRDQRFTVKDQKQERNSEAQLINELKQSNLSKMLSEFSIVSEQDESMTYSQQPHQQFSNPLGLQNTNQANSQQRQSQQYQGQQEQFRGTFGQNPYFQPKMETTQIIEKSYIDEELIDDLSVLKDKVMGLLQAYADDIHNSKNEQLIKSQIQKDAQEVAKDYSQILEKVNQSNISNIQQNIQGKEEQLNTLSNLVVEFLTKFDGSAPMNVSRIIEDKLEKSRNYQETPKYQDQQSKFLMEQNQFHNQSNRSQDRLQAPETIQKTDSSKDNIDKGERFTFQTKQSQQAVISPRDTFGKQQLQKNNQAQFINEVNEQNLSKMLSDFSIVTEQEESMIQNQQQFNNPIGMQTTPQQSQVQQQEQFRGTFGQNPYFQTQVEVSKVIEKSQVNEKTYIEEELIDDLSVLKGKVMGLLQAYADDLSKSNNEQLIKSKIQDDVKQVAQDYSKILDKVNQSDISYLQVSQIKDKQLNQLSNLVVEFLYKFEGSKPMNVSRMIGDKIEKSRHQQQVQLDLTILPNIPCNETFYQYQDLDADKLAKKIQKLKESLSQELERKQMHYSKRILSDMIQNLYTILKANDLQTVKTVIFKMDQIIKQLSQEDTASLQLYDYMVKAMRATKKRIQELDASRRTQNEVTEKTKFFECAHICKTKLPHNHPGHDQMISAIYEEYLQSGKPDNVEQFIQDYLMKFK